MATYNGRKYIVEQLESIRLQSRGLDELVIVDDASTDDTVQMVRDYIDQHGLQDRWQLHCHEQNAGYIRTFKEALGLARGDIIFLSDQDDRWKPERVERCYQIMQDKPQIQVLACSFDGIDGSGQTIPVREPVLTANHGMIMLRSFKPDQLAQLKLREAVERTIAQGCTLAITSRVAQRYAADTADSSIPHDRDLTILAAREAGLFFWNHAVIDYRMHEDNTIGLKSDSDDVDVSYRVQEYRAHVQIYDEIMRCYGDVDIRRAAAKWKRFTGARLDALEHRSVAQLVAIAIENIPALGIKAGLAMMDARAIKRLG